MPSDTERVSLAVVRLNRRLRQERHSELSPTQMSILGMLRTVGPSTPSAIAAREKVRPPTITRTLHALSEEGLVEREPDVDDRRQVVVSISTLGEKVLADERARRDAWLSRRLRGLDARERAVLREASALMIDLADS